MKQRQYLIQKATDDMAQGTFFIAIKNLIIDLIISLSNKTMHTNIFGSPGNTLNSKIQTS